LSILDLTSSGAQPMLSPSGRYVLVYNGEIYNHRELRDELVAAGVRFHGRSDTEVLLAAIEQWGVEAALRRAVGMFAAGCWDRRDRRLLLFRDRMGEKPLYLARAPGALLFASELKAIAAWPGFAPTLDAQALTSFFRQGYIPAPLTIWREARKLPAGTLLALTRDDAAGASIPLDRARAYWSILDVAVAGQAHPASVPDAEAITLCEEALSRAISDQRVADVPVGLFLSGGIDSSLVLALLQRQTDRPVRTFTVGFAEEPFDETLPARAVAERLGSEHTEFVVSPDDARAVIPRLPEVFDEPFADISQIPTLLLAERARAAVTVALTGDGGDESFGGYSRYRLAHRLAQLLALPGSLRRGAAAAIEAITERRLEDGCRLLPARWRSRVLAAASGDRLRKLAAALSAPDLATLYRRSTSLWDDPTEVIAAPSESSRCSIAHLASADELDPRHAMMLVDSLVWLPDDILVKTDRATMAASLEVRAPLLDHRLVELAWRLGIHQKIRAGHGKWILREILARYLPRQLVERPKTGFRVPIGSWLRGPLRSWADQLLDPADLRRDGLLLPETVHRLWRQHVAGAREHGDQLWAILVFRAWQHANRGSTTPSNSIALNAMGETPAMLRLGEVAA
jgi:asparagine synthase (glutamine-hydrolysing)